MLHLNFAICFCPRKSRSKKKKRFRARYFAFYICSSKLHVLFETLTCHLLLFFYLLQYEVETERKHVTSFTEENHVQEPQSVICLTMKLNSLFPITTKKKKYIKTVHFKIYKVLQRSRHRRC